ncbi:HAMP domain-containing histidine kinase [Allokutzneria sp. A3M-2-11 16]|uniref:sensor histidine kinase n=1 Tax=Allokutzneria sp. A3M-2-11 16 TaxID=2962043 RepID=UPI0020B8897C|nr:HAMP domain-containing sensor histidine kinase [Allokutzneria sp. A3M-2-11 16]MCP3798994.1 HAMP domain-containing histidine kinase [Allokutzneria sp. A3M-2-11 16]
MTRPFRWFRGRLDRVPLRSQLVVGLSVLVTGGMVGMGLLAVTAVRNNLVAQVDRGLTEIDVTRLDLKPPGRQPSASPRAQLPGTFLVMATDATGRVLGELRMVDVQFQGSPVLSGVLPRTRGLVTVPSTKDGKWWRILLREDNGGRHLITASTLDDVDDVVEALSITLLAIGGIVLTLLGALGQALVRLSLRPLGEVQETARRIADGDLSSRVPARPENTEVGELAAALNTMLVRIEDSFRAQQRSEEAARRSEERMRRFVADASHELRTPLTSIRGYAELYRQGAATDPEQPLRRIEDEAARMGLLVDDLLLLARLDQQRERRDDLVDLGVLAVDVVADARAAAPERPVRLKLGETSGLLVRGDEDRLRQVLANLVGNALRHTPGDVPVEVGVRADGEDVVLSVTDSGPGLASADAERIFERFYRADAGRSRSHGGGTGLGLAIVAAIVASHGGEVSVSTAPGEGASFRVRLRGACHGGS